MGEIASAVGSIRQAVGDVKSDLGIPTVPQSGDMSYMGADQPQMQNLSAPNMAGMAPVQTADMSQGMQMTPMVAAMLGQQQQQQQAPAPTPAPVDNKYTPYDNPGSDQPIEVTGDDWKPKKQGDVGKVMDILLMLRGRRPVFKDRVDEKNLESAMKGWQKDPDRALARVRQIDPATAINFQNKLADTAAAKALEAQRATANLQNGGNIISSGLGAVLSAKTPEQRQAIYSRVLPTLRGIAEKSGYPQDLLPDTYDEDVLNTVRASGLSSYQQDRLNQYNQAIQDLRKYRGSRLSQFDRGLSQQEEHNNVMEGIAQQNANTNARTENRLTPKTLRTPNGEMTLDPKDPNVGYIGDSQWRKVKKNADGSWQWEQFK